MSELLDRAIRLGLGIAYRRIFGDTPDDTAQPSSPNEVGAVSSMLRLKREDGGVLLNIGRRTSGKTVLALRQAEVLGRETYMVSPEVEPPHWVKEIKLEELDRLPPRYSTLILDDVPAYMSSRSYTNPFVQTVEALIPVVRHRRKIFLIFNTQMASMADKYIMDADLVFFKPPNVLFQDLERPAVARWFKKVQPMFQVMTDMEQKKHAYLVTQSWHGMITVDLPSKGLR